MVNDPIKAIEEEYNNPTAEDVLVEEKAEKVSKPRMLKHSLQYWADSTGYYVAMGISRVVLMSPKKPTLHQGFWKFEIPYLNISNFVTPSSMDEHDYTKLITPYAEDGE